MKIAPSILNAPLDNLEKLLEELKDAYMIHLDVMDGKFVKNISFGKHFCEEIKRLSKLPLDIHLMVENPFDHLKDFLNLSPKFITVHIESNDIKKSIELIKKNGVGVGLAFNPETSIDQIKKFIKDVDLVLVMTVNPGFGGQKFIEKCLSKVDFLQTLKKENNFIIEVDGGVDDSNLNYCRDRGVDVSVVGSYLFKLKNKSEWLKAKK